MEYKLINQKGYDLHLFKTNKFKTYAITVKFLGHLTRENVTKRALIPYVLKAGTKNYPNKQKLSLRTDDLFDLSISVASSRYGKSSLIQFSMSFIDQKYVNYKSLTKDSIDLLREIIFNPLTKDKGFDKKIVLEEKRLLREEIESSLDNKEVKANQEFLQIMLKGLDIAIPASGYIEDLEEIDEENLYQEYQNMLNNDMLDIVITGDIDDDMKNLIEERFNYRSYNPLVIPYHVIDKEVTNVEKVIKTDKDITQGKLYLGYFYPFTLKDFYIYNTIATLLGLSPSSKLFVNVREKASLCYNVYCNFNNFHGYAYIYAGINPKNFEKALELIIEQVKALQKGDFTNLELQYAKNSIINSLKEGEDAPFNNASRVYAIKLNNRSSQIEDIIKEYLEVKREEIIECANRLTLNTIYMLKGEA